MEKRNIAIFFGGCSSEYQVSLESAAAVMQHMDTERYRAIPVGISPQGGWYYFQGRTEQIRADAWFNETDCVPAVLSPDPAVHGLLIFHKEGTEKLYIDAAFPVMHGRFGEDGTIQGLIELAGIPLVGCGVLSSALCMDKDRAHRMARMAGIAVPQSLVLERADRLSRMSEAAVPQSPVSERADRLPRMSEAAVPQSPVSERTDRLEVGGGKAQKSGSSDGQAGECLLGDAQYTQLLEFCRRVGYPVFVKPVRAGSSYGITKVTGEAQLRGAVVLAFQYDRQILVEETIEGFEVGCAVLGCDTLWTGEVDEIELSQGFFDYTEKYTLKTSAIHVPARIDAAVSQKIQETAKVLYRALDCSVFARVDLFLTPKGEIVFNEINTIPGFTEHSRYPGMMKAAGMDFAELIDRMIGLAVMK